MMRLRLQMLVPVSARCSWNRRMSSAVAVSGERLIKPANRLQSGASKAAPTIILQPALARSPQPRPAPTARALPPGLVAQGGKFGRRLTPELNSQENVWQFTSELALQSNLQIVRRHRPSLLLRLEHSHRPA